MNNCSPQPRLCLEELYNVKNGKISAQPHTLIMHTALCFTNNRGILADVIVYIFSHLHRALRTKGKVLDIN